MTGAAEAADAALAALGETGHTVSQTMGTGFTGGPVGLPVPAFAALVEGAREAGEEASLALGEELERGGRMAMQSLLEGLLTGRDRILQSVARIGIAIGSQLLTGGLFNVLGIGSPAKQGVYAGRMLGLGIAQGLQASLPGVVAASFQAGRAALAGLALSGPHAGVAVPSGSATMPQVPQAAMAASGPGDGELTLRFDTSSLPPRPRTTTPEAAAHDDWWRRAFSALRVDFTDRGGRFD